MDLANPTSHAAQAYATAGRFVPLLSPPAVTGPRFELPTPTSLPRAVPPTPPPPPAPSPAPTTSDATAAPVALPRPTLPPQAPVDLTAAGRAAGPPDIATVHRATALYGQIQQLTAGFGAAPPPLLSPPKPSDAADEARETPRPRVGPVGIYSPGGVAASPTPLLAFARGTFLNVLT
jgi:hypothetical protein